MKHVYKYETIDFLFLYFKNEIHVTLKQENKYITQVKIENREEKITTDKAKLSLQVSDGHTFIFTKNSISSIALYKYTVQIHILLAGGCFEICST